MGIKKICYRPRQFLFCKAQNMLPWRMPKTISGAGSIYKVPDLVKSKGIKKVMLVTTEGFIKRGTLEPLFNDLKKDEVEYIIYHNVKPDPTIECIENGVKLYNAEGCEAIIAVGGGSVMDCSKIIGARAVKPNQQVADMAGLLKVRKKLHMLIAVPTTAGTGSETTVAAVVTDSATHRKYAISDMCLMPDYAVLDPVITCGLPKKMTATTGMDALTHAVEAYTNKYAPRDSRKHAVEAVKLIFNNLTKAYDDGKDVGVRENMLKASFYAGEAFTKAYVGYVHAIAHAVGGLYGISHGMANAVILPVVLDAFGDSIYDELSELADAVNIKGSTKEEKSKKFIEAIRNMNRYMDIPDKLDAIEEKDIPTIISRAIKEANPTYPVPVIWDENQFRKVIEKL